MSKITEKLNNLATTPSTDWLVDAKNRQKNKEWLKHSQKIAIKVLRTLREKSIKQKELAIIIGVSSQQINKIVKGRENLTLDTISKLEIALDISLIFNDDNLENELYKDFIESEKGKLLEHSEVLNEPKTKYSLK